jgi:MFS family permease
LIVSFGTCSFHDKYEKFCVKLTVPLGILDPDFEQSNTARTHLIVHYYPTIRLIASLLLMTIGGSAMYASVIVLAPAAQEFQTGRGAASLPYAFFMIGFGLGGVVMGRLADRFGIIVPALIGSLCLPAGLYVASLAATIMQFGLALGVLCGFLGASFVFAPMVADVSHWFTVRRGLAVGIAISGSYVAGAVWPPVVQHFVDVDGWRATYVWLSVFTLCTMLPLCVFLYRRPPVESADGGSAAIKPLQYRTLAMPPNVLQCLLCVAGVGCCVAMAMPQVHIVPYVLDRGFAAARGAEMLSLMLGFGIVSRVMSGWISDRVGGLRTLLVGSLLQGLVLVMFLAADSLTMLYATSIAFGLVQGGIVPSYAMIVRTFFPASQAGWRIGSVFLFTICGMALGGWMAGAIYDATGSYTWSYINAIAFNVMNLLIAVLLLRQYSRLKARESLSDRGEPAGVEAQ